MYCLIHPWFPQSAILQFTSFVTSSTFQLMHFCGGDDWKPVRHPVYEKNKNIEGGTTKGNPLIGGHKLPVTLS